MNAQRPQNLGYTLKAAWSCHDETANSLIYSFSIIARSFTEVLPHGYEKLRKECNIHLILQEALPLLFFVLIINRAFYLPFFRCHMTLHLLECPEKAVKCPVAGCTAIMRRKKSKEHVVTAASSHTVLQAVEVQRLRGIVHFKVSNASFSLVLLNEIKRPVYKEGGQKIARVYKQNFTGRVTLQPGMT